MSTQAAELAVRFDFLFFGLVDQYHALNHLTISNMVFTHTQAQIETLAHAMIGFGEREINACICAYVCTSSPSMALQQISMSNTVRNRWKHHTNTHIFLIRCRTPYGESFNCIRVRICVYDSSLSLVPSRSLIPDKE